MRSRREHKSFFVRYAPALGVLFVILVVFLIKPGGIFRSAAFVVLRPFAALSGGIGHWFSDAKELLHSKKTLAEKNTELENRLRQLQAESQTLQALRNTNASLTELLNKRTDHTRILAGILMQPPQLPYDTMLIDSGTKDGVQRGDQVYAYGDIAIGVVTEVGSKTASVMLYSTPGRKTPAFLLSATSSVAVDAIGQGSGNFMIELPRGTTVATDSPVVLPGSAAILLGNVGAVVHKPTDAFATVLFASPVSMRSLRVVEVAPGN